MSTSTIKPMPTLKGIFSPPKMIHRRDFLRENKLNLRELQRVTNKKPSTTQQQNLQGTYQFHAQQQQQQQQQINANRRSSSQTRLAPMKQTTRSTSEHRIANAHTSVPPPQPQSTTHQLRQRSTRCPSCNGRTDTLGVTSSTSSGVALKKTQSRDKEIQTDDINDEEFLYGALKKCTSSEQNCKINTKPSFTDKQAINDASARSRQSKSDSNLPPLTTRSDKSNHGFCRNDGYVKRDNHQTFESNHHNQYEIDANNEEFHPAAPLTTRSHDRLDNGHIHNEDEDDNLNFGNLAIDNQQQENGPQSGRSRRTVCSMNSQDGTARKKKSTTGSVHKFGSREDIRLPRYLEREKRDKEEQRLRQEERDPHCPPGHFVLSEDERLNALAVAEKKFKSLINELNRMPITITTFRIRSRKAEIEKELVVLESDIRIFSKPKVYVKHEDSEA